MSERVLIVDDGRVRCPVRRRDVEVDDCLGCGRLREARLDADLPVIVCVLGMYEALPAD